MLGTLMATVTNIGIDSAMLEPIADNLVAALAVVMPIGITLFGIMLGPKIVTRVIHMFIH